MLRQRGHVALRIADGGKFLIDHQEDGAGDLAGAHHYFIVDVLAGIDDDGVVLFDQEGGELAEHISLK